MKRLTKKDIYKAARIECKDGKILVPEFGFMPELLINGNEKIGKGIWHFSTLPTKELFHVVINGKEIEISGTCPCSCVGCYATKGNYRFPSTIESLAYRTYLVNNYLDFVERAIVAQIHAGKIKFVRIHASGDFVSLEYIEMWKRIVAACPSTHFWTYTKNKAAENAFDDFENANIVKSVIPGKGFNFGHCDYILSVYEFLKLAGKRVYICRCGIDKNQHLHKLPRL